MTSTAPTIVEIAAAVVVVAQPQTPARTMSAIADDGQHQPATTPPPSPGAADSGVGAGWSSSLTSPDVVILA